MTANDHAKHVLNLYAPQLRWVCDSVKDSFDLPEDDMPDWQQEARILVMSYMGIMPGRHFNMVEVWKRKSGDDPIQIRAMLAYELRIDLSQLIARSLAKTPPSTSLNDLVEDQEFDVEDPNSEADLYNQEQANRYMRRYPTLALFALEGVSQEEIAEQRGVDIRTIRRHVAREKRAFLTDALKRANLVVEGDEPMAELEEAYTNVTKVRR